MHTIFIKNPFLSDNRRTYKINVIPNICVFEIFTFVHYFVNIANMHIFGIPHLYTMSLIVLTDCIVISAYTSPCPTDNLPLDTAFIASPAARQLLVFVRVRLL